MPALAVKVQDARANDASWERPAGLVVALGAPALADGPQTTTTRTGRTPATQARRAIPTAQVRTAYRRRTRRRTNNLAVEQGESLLSQLTGSSDADSVRLETLRLWRSRSEVESCESRAHWLCRL